MTNEPAERPDDTPPDDAPAPEETPSADAAPAPEVGLPIEDVAPEELDPCPRCGSPLRGADALVCLRCGYDLRTLDAHETATGDDAVAPADEDDADDPEAPADALVKDAAADPWLGLGLAGVAVALLLIGTLLGAHGLFPSIVANHDAEGGALIIDWSDRLLGVLRIPLLLAMWLGAAMAAFVALAWYWHQPIGAWRAALTRTLGLVATARLVAFFAIPWPALGFPVEAVAAAVIFIGGAMATFGLAWRRAALWLGVTVVAFLVLFVFAQLVVFAT